MTDVHGRIGFLLAFAFSIEVTVKTALSEDDEVVTDNLTPLNMNSGRRKTNSFRFNNLTNAKVGNATAAP